MNRYYSFRHLHWMLYPHWKRRLQRAALAETSFHEICWKLMASVMRWMWVTKLCLFVFSGWCERLYFLSTRLTYDPILNLLSNPMNWNSYQFDTHLIITHHYFERFKIWMPSKPIGFEGQRSRGKDIQLGLFFCEDVSVNKSFSSIYTQPLDWACIHVVHLQWI